MELTRRNFLAGITLAGAGLASAGLAACAPKAGNEEDAKPSAASSKTSEVAEPAAHNPESTESCDIVVVGSGTAGVCAAAKAAQMGAKVIMLEKNAMYGGSSGFAEGLGALNSYIHRGENQQFDLDEAFQRIQDYHHWGPDSKVLKAFLANSGRTIDWLHDECGINFFKATVTAPTSYPSWHLLADQQGNVTRVKQGLIDPMVDYIQSIGVDARLENPATGLIVENDVVKGVYAEDDGKEYAIEASNVILATGGWADSERYFDEFAHIEFGRVHNWGASGRDGDGISWACDLGAQLHFPANIMYGSTQIPGAGEFEDPAGWIFSWNPGLRVNQAAERFFNEMLIADFSVAGNSIINQEKVFTIIDQAYVDQCCNVALPQGLDSIPGQETGKPLEGGAEAIAEAVEKGNIFKADTIEELASMMELDATALKETVDAYNGYAADGVDPEFGCPASGLVPVATAPFYAAQNNPAMFATVGGLYGNEYMQVLRNDGSVIEGLYAIGGDNSSYCGPCYDVGVLSGSQQGWCATGAVLAVEHMLG